MDIQKIAEFFSLGKFHKVIKHLSDDIVWNVVGGRTFKGKVAVIKDCEQTERYFQSVDTDFKIINRIVDNNKIAITGTAKISKNGKRIDFSYACDVFEFNEDQKITKITSYCISEHEDVTTF
ncbi:nuclear transport factor 2 family protein [Brumimicrobium sp.]|uniref:nuclear transport factor 2 family protein n=1 Tax=Brumimicrobium sp. TaxID=2029867 RepID=UPI003A8CFBDA